MLGSQAFSILAGEASNVEVNVFPIHLLVEKEEHLCLFAGEKKIARVACNQMASTRVDPWNWVGDAEEASILGDKDYLD